MNQDQSQSTNLPSQSKKNKVRIIPLILGIILLVGSAAYFLTKATKNAQPQVSASPKAVSKTATDAATVSPKPGIDPSKLETYVDPTYPFSIQIPPQVIHTNGEYLDNKSYYTVSFKPDPKFYSSSDQLLHPKGLEIRVSKNPKKLNSKDYIEQIYIGGDTYFSEPNMKKQIESDEKVADLPGLDATWVDVFAGGPGSIGPQVFIAKDENIYQIISADHEATGAKTLQLELDTFKFTK